MIAIAGCMWSSPAFSSCALPLLLCLSLAVPSFLSFVCFSTLPPLCPQPPRPLIQPSAPSPDTHEEYPINIKQVYKAFAAVPHSLAVLEAPQVGQMLLKVVSMSWFPHHPVGLPVGHFVPFWRLFAVVVHESLMVVSTPGVHLTGTLMCLIHLSIVRLMLVLIFDSLLSVKCFLSSNSSLVS